MAGNMQDRGVPDRARVNVNDDHELRYWTKKFGVTQEQLIAAVSIVGVSADEIEQYLKMKHRKR
jgi:hypothetical protein